ncbi:MAG: MOSC domain-containing protein [Marivirga sp.]|nr:MOSC domain-containing protein [Marivirga sp.]
MIEHPDLDTLETGLEGLQNSPKDDGSLEMIVVRPEKKHRATLLECELTLKRGVEGDHWAKGCWKSLPDGSPDPDVQITIMNSRCLELISASRSRWPLAGDNLIVDMDLSIHNLQPGQKLSIGSAVLEITSVPHTGCNHFKERFGIDSLKFISSKRGKELRLRGIYARVIKDGQIKVGDRLKKVVS